MTYVETRINIWEALAGRAPGAPAGPTDPDLWGAVVDRLNPARARPVLRGGIEAMQMSGVRGVDYIMLRSPDDGTRAGYLRLTPEEWQLTLLMDGSHTVARLVAEFARIAGRLAPDQVRRVVADLAGHRMLDELPMDAFRPLEEMQRKPLPERVGGSVLGAARGRRVLAVPADRLFARLYRAGGRLFFGRAATIVQGVLIVAGLALFLATWARGSQPLFLTGESYLLGAITLLVLNVVVLIAHEFSRALATKHVGREVPAAGVLVYFGIPSFFVDTADAWMAGRRARMLVTAVGPLSSLVLAGLAEVTGLALPFLGGLAFKLAFLCYLNAFVNLSPLLPLDGYYLLMDWLEIPQLRARGLSWVSGRLRGRPPRWSMLDREGRLIGLYGLLAVLWLAFATVLVVRVWSDRISGLAAGLWFQGLGGTLLFLLVVVGLGARPICFLLARLTRWWSRHRQRSAENDREADTPRRLAALRASDLGGLPEPALHGLAARARWVHPPTGRQMVSAGGSQSAVYVVVQGALHGRTPGDPAGTIRHQVGPGGVVGLVDALTGRSTQLDWFTAGTTLLSLPTATVATVVGPLPGPPPQDSAEAEALFADTPALAGLAADQRLALIASAHPVDLEAGGPIILPGPTHAVVVESGVIAMADGVELRRGTLIGPVGDGSPGMVAQARTPVRLWVVPDASDLPPLVGATHRPGSPMPVVTAKGGLTAARATPDGYPPLAVPPGLTEGVDDPEVDRRFERGMRWLATLLLAAALAFAGLLFAPGPAWAEMPTDRALLTVDHGRLTAYLDGSPLTLVPGDRRYVAAGSQVDVPASGAGLLTFPGGSAALLCAGSRVTVGRLSADAGRHTAPFATLSLQSGRILADTAAASGAYRPLDLTVTRMRSEVTNAGAAWFAVEPATLTVSNGAVSAGGASSPATHASLACADGVPVSPPSAGGESSTTDAPFPSDSSSIDPSAATASISPSATVTPSQTPDPTTTTTTAPTEAATTQAPTTTKAPTTTTKAPTTTPAPTPTTTPPTTPPTTSPTATATPTTADSSSG